jgi:DNA-binding transcriptional LysR family regulator
MSQNLAALDLNLLLVLEVLLAERSVTRAARRLGLSQSATSHALGRLRQVLDDPLFVRSPRGLVPTARAIQLASPLRAAFGELRSALSGPSPFEPATAAGTVRICTADFGQSLLVPGLCATVARQAPQVQLITTGFPQDVQTMLSSGQADLALGMAGVGPELNQIVLVTEPFRCVVRRGHPALQDGADTLPLDTYAELGHVLVSQKGVPRGFVDRALSARGLSRKVALVVPHLLPAAQAVAVSDLVWTAPVRLAETAAQLLPLRVLEPPLEIEPFSLAMSWHDRRHGDPLHAWIREQIRELAQQGSGRQRHPGPVHRDLDPRGQPADLGLLDKGGDGLSIVAEGGVVDGDDVSGLQ